MPEDTGDNVIGSVKLTVPAVPTLEPSSCTTIPEPDAVTPLSPEPSPIYLTAVNVPVLGL